jgi:hypothetical protein
MAHNVVSSDQIRQMIPWTTVTWVQVHQGHLPLWNPYGLLGMPFAFNFVVKLGDEDLYRIPGAAPATLTPMPPTGALPPANAVGTPLGVTHPIRPRGS